ncbi:hypothetical protein ACIJQ5_23170 (plasmid) [Escherichia coli]|uniref:hypothetical protein n=1 Tax=Escherichia coli TaxID=562 RepID=UPI0039F74132
MSRQESPLSANFRLKRHRFDGVFQCTLCFDISDSYFTNVRFRSIGLQTPLPEQHAAEARYPIPVEDFRFSIFTAVNNQTVMTSSAEIVLVIEGTATLSHASGESLLLHVGLSAFIPASIGRWLLTTTGKVCRVSC